MSSKIDTLVRSSSFEWLARKDKVQTIDIPKLKTLCKIYDQYSPAFFGIDLTQMETEDDIKFYLNLDVTLPLEKIEAIARTHSIIQLRPIDERSKILIIGCGNCPIDDGSGLGLATDFYRERHAHPEAITIDQSLSMNSTLVAPFGEVRFPMLASHHFDTIIIEGTKIPHTELADSELQRLRSRDGKIYKNYGSKECYQFSWEINDDLSFNTGLPDGKHTRIKF
jgi:hypothetical protein